ncbi:imidazole glycerol phosphate synthase subunit HisF [bacterium]|jgi:imidazole glycerol-phosphate synthase subunit HisF|nr:imidazole glycerol phosphate synthase subunit HisF [bacterium]
MLKKRVIFTLLYDNGSFMLSRNFRLQKVGDLHWLKRNYNFSDIAFSIDELIILDVTRGNRNEERFYEHVRFFTEECFVPIASGGGIRTLEQASQLIYSGADKVVVNTLVVENPNIIIDIATKFGAQCIVASIDVGLANNKFNIWTDNGSVKQEIGITELLNNIASLPIGELYLNSINHDGTGHGYENELLDFIPDKFPIPVILAGGAGKYKHFANALQDERVDAVATAHLFNFVGNGLQEAREQLLNDKFNLAVWDVNLAKYLANCI